MYIQVYMYTLFTSTTGKTYNEKSLTGGLSQLLCEHEESSHLSGAGA